MADSYTVKQLTDVEDSAAKMGFGEMGSARFASADLDAEDTGVSFHKLNANTRQAFGHRHENAEEIYVVVDGSARVKLDDEIVELGEFDALRVSPGVVRQFEGGPDGVTLLAFGPQHKGDGEVIPGWWSD